MLHPEQGATVQHHVAHRQLLAHALDRPRSHLRAWPDDIPDAAPAARYAGLVERRAAGEPVAYLTGRRGFWTFELAVTPATTRVTSARPSTCSPFGQ